MRNMKNKMEEKERNKQTSKDGMLRINENIDTKKINNRSIRNEKKMKET